MPLKTDSNCLNFIDSMILYNIEKRDSIEEIDNVRDYFLDCYNEKSKEELQAILPLLYQINLIIELFDIPIDYNISDLYFE